MKESTKEYHRKRKQWIEDMGGKCVKCGSKEKIEFDHINPKDKKYNIAKVWYDDSKVLPELKKCQLLCNNCHLEKTKSEYEKVERIPKHGTITEYFRFKCRCCDCKHSYSVWKREYRLKKGETGGKRRKYNQPSPHGTTLSYTRGCRCFDCRAANTERAKVWRGNSKLKIMEV